MLPYSTNFMTCSDLRHQLTFLFPGALPKLIQGAGAITGGKPLIIMEKLSNHMTGVRRQRSDGLFPQHWMD